MNAATSWAGIRPFRVYDGDGALVGDFAAWLPAHRWAHQRVTEPGTRLPVEIEDRSRQYVEQVWPDHCQTLHAADPAIIPSCPLAAVDEPALRVLPGGLTDTASCADGTAVTDRGCDLRGDAGDHPVRGAPARRTRPAAGGGTAIRSRRGQR